MPLRDAVITRHAWDRFVSRWEGPAPVCFNTELLQMIRIAEEEDLGSGAVVRMLKNGCKPARYFRTDTWRFVTDEDVSNILTIERAYLGMKRPIKKMGHKSRYGGKP